MPVTLTPALWAAIQNVQWDVNHGCDYTIDAPDDWHGAADFDKLGDCKNYAADKFGRCLALGVPREDLRLCCLWTEALPNAPNGGYHCILLVDTDSGCFALDQRQADVLPLEKLRELGYHGLIYQTCDRAAWETGPF